MAVTILVYKDNHIVPTAVPLETLATLRNEPGVMLWVDLGSPSEEEIKLVMETGFALHPLVIEDCMSDTPFPKLEEYEDYLYLVMHAVDFSRQDKFTTTELDLILGKNFIVTFHRLPLKPIQAAIERYQRNHSLTVRGPDRITHTILDLMVENYKPAIEELRRDLETIEGHVLRGGEGTEIFSHVASLRKDLASLRQIVRPQREIVASLAEGKNRFFRALLLPYLRDLEEDLSRIQDQAASWSDQLILSFRVYLNKSSHEANNGIKVITGITALTIPMLTVGAWYGMNFKHMPELPLVSSYWFFMAITITGTIAMAWLMKKKKWL